MNIVTTCRLPEAMEDVVTTAETDSRVQFSPEVTSKSGLTGVTSPSDSGASSASFHTAASDNSFTCGGDTCSLQEDPKPDHSTEREGTKTPPTAVDTSDDIISNTGGEHGETLGNDEVIVTVDLAENDAPNDTASPINTRDGDTVKEVPTDQPAVMEEVPGEKDADLNEALRPGHLTVETSDKTAVEVSSTTAGEMEPQQQVLIQTNTGTTGEPVELIPLPPNNGGDATSHHEVEESTHHDVVESANQKGAGDAMRCESSVENGHPGQLMEGKMEGEGGEAMDYQNQAAQSANQKEETPERAGAEATSELSVKTEEEAMEVAVPETTENTPEESEKCESKENSPSGSLSSVEQREEGGGGREGDGENTPSVSSSGYGGSREVSPEEDTVGGVITEDMKEEEKRLRERESREQSVGEEVGTLISECDKQH